MCVRARSRACLCMYFIVFCLSFSRFSFSLSVFKKKLILLLLSRERCSTTLGYLLQWYKDSYNYIVGPGVLRSRRENYVPFTDIAVIRR